jgi:hypothetical protein
MQKNLTILLSVICAVLAIVSAYLSFALYQKPRFTQVSGSNPYIMFDQKTAQACWIGPASAPGDPYKQYGGSVTPNDLAKGFVLDETNSANLPFCKNLK